METIVEMLRVAGAVLSIAGISIGAVQMIRSGFLFLTARGDSQQIHAAKDILWHSILGMAIIVGA